MKTNDSGEVSNNGPVTWDDVLVLQAELKRAARTVLSHERNAGTVHTTQLLNDALKKLIPKSRDWREVSWESRRFFFADLHQAMWRRVTEYARERNRKKRRVLQAAGNLNSEFLNPLLEAGVLNLDRLLEDAGGNADLVEDIENALAELDRVYPDQQFAEIVQFRCINRLSQVDIGTMLGLKPDAVRKREQRAYSLLRVALRKYFKSDDLEDRPQ